MNNFFRIKYRLEFESPYVISSAVTETGMYDITTVTDPDGLPFIPPSTIRGRIKASLQEFCSINYSKYSLCSIHTLKRDGVPPSSNCPLCRIFGAPGGEFIRGFFFSGAYVPEQAREVFKRMRNDVSGLTLYKRTRNQIDRKLRRAREDALFSIGAVPSVLTLGGELVEEVSHQKIDNHLRESDLALILIGMRLITEIGLSKNRGFGRCRFTPVEILPNIRLWQDIIHQHINSHLRGR